MINYHIATGNLKRPKICPKCKESSKKVEAHHEDYSKPLEIKWLCRGCHASLHQQID